MVCMVANFWGFYWHRQISYNTWNIRWGRTGCLGGLSLSTLGATYQHLRRVSSYFPFFNPPGWPCLLLAAIFARDKGAICELVAFPLLATHICVCICFITAVQNVRIAYNFYDHMQWSATQQINVGKWSHGHLLTCTDRCCMHLRTESAHLLTVRYF